ncbi:MAG: phage major capsid protein [Candidatus Pacebacteria bacterium]|nr:phage major capsid protein [Candidatus Paceibacterota bacterium]
MFVKLKKNIDEHKAGDVIDIADEKVARGYIEYGFAEESDAQAHVSAMVRSQLSDATAGITKELEDLKRSLQSGGNKPSKGPPSKGMEFDDDGVPFNGTIEHTESPADRGVDGKAIGRGLGEILGLLYRTRPSASQGERDHADQRLVEHFKLERTWDGSMSTASPAVARAGSESLSGGSAYGYFVKPEILGGYNEIAMEESLIEPYAFNIPVGATNEVHWPALDQYFAPGIGQTSATAGIQVFYKGESTQRQASDAKLREITYKIVDQTAYTQISRDLVADNYISAATVLQSLFLKAMAYKTDFVFLNGDGAGKPTGIRQSPALLTATRLLQNKIQLADLQAMLALFDMSCLKNAMFIAHQATYSQLLNVRDGTTLAFQPNSQITQAAMLSSIAGTKSAGMRYQAAGTLLGLPIRFTTEKLEVSGTGDIMLIDPTQYGVANRSGIEVAISEQFLFDTDQIAYRWKQRHDGKSLWMGPRQSTSPSGVIYKTSPFVQLSLGS